jgi:protein translocase SecG subunit
MISSGMPYIQIVLAVLVIGLILLQQSGGSSGAGLGGDNMSSAFHTRRGSEKVLFITTIVVAVLFVLSAFTALVL